MNDARRADVEGRALPVVSQSPFDASELQVCADLPLDPAAEETNVNLYRTHSSANLKVHTRVHSLVDKKRFRLQPGESMQQKITI